MGSSRIPTRWQDIAGAQPYSRFDFLSNDMVNVSPNAPIYTSNGVSLPGATLQGGGSATLTSSTTRSAFIPVATCQGIRPVFSNIWWGQNGQSFGTLNSGMLTSTTYTANPITITASFEDASGNLHQATFGGQTSYTMAPGELVAADEIPVAVTGGTACWIRSCVSVKTLGMQWPSGTQFGSPAAMAASNVDATMSAGTSAFTSGITWTWQPIAVLGRALTGGPPPSIISITDSIGYGAGDSTGLGFIRRGLGATSLYTGNYGYICSSIQGNYALTRAFGSTQRYRHGIYRLADVAVVHLGVNDLTVGKNIGFDPTADPTYIPGVIGALQTIYSGLAGDGLIVLPVCVFPAENGTSQVQGWALGRHQINSFIRTIPAACAGYIDLNPAIETTPESSGVNEVQNIVVDATGGTFTLSWNGSAASTPLPFNATVFQVSAALQALSSTGVGNIVAAQGQFNGANYYATFTGTLGKAPQALITANASGLTGGGSTVTITHWTAGSVPTLGSNQWKSGYSDPADGIHPNDTGAAAAGGSFGTQIQTILQRLGQISVPA